MNMIFLTFFLLCAYCSITSTVRGQYCTVKDGLSGEISDWNDGNYGPLYCWSIRVSQDSYMRLELKELSLGDISCSSVYLKIFVNGKNETYRFCAEDTNPKPIIALNDVTITYYHSKSYTSRTSFRLLFTKENLICTQKDHFRCSSNFCIQRYLVCNGFDDCPDGADEVGCENLICTQKDPFRSSSNFCIQRYLVCNGFDDCPIGADEVGCERGIAAVKGMKISRINAITWLKNQQTESFDWGKNTHRAITALYLAKAMIFQDEDLEEERIAKQLMFQTAVALLRNASDPISINELSMFVNALAVTCHNPRNFYGYDLLQILSDRVASAKSPVPSAYLTLCNLNWTLSDSDVKNLLKLLQKPSEYPFHLDVRALTIMALSCVKNTPKSFKNIAYAENLYNLTIQDFTEQLSDGSFGNVYTTALVTQALISSGEEQSKQWNATATAQYLMEQLNSSSINFLSVYLTLPIFSGRSLVDIKAVDCSNKTRKVGNDKDISDVTDKLGGKMRIQYSLYIGDQKDVIHTIYLRMPQNSSAFDVMRVAQVADPKYKFLYRQNSDQMYIYEIAGIINDPEAGKFWLLYKGHQVKDNVKHHTESPDKFILGENDHLIMWYRTAHI